MGEITASVRDSITDVKRGEWNAIVAQQSRTGSVFERYEWLAAYEAVTDESPHYVQVRKDDTLVGVHPTFERDFPGTPFRFLGPTRPGSNGVMVSTQEAAVLDAILDAVEELTSGRTVGHLLKPGSSASLRYANRFSARGYVPSVRDCQFVVDLEDTWPEFERSLSQKKRRNLGKADEAGVSGAAVEVTADSIDAFARRHDRHMARIDGSGASRPFLQSLRTHLGDRLVLFRASIDGDVAGEILAVRDDEQSTLHLVFPAYDPERFRQYASEAVYRVALQWGFDSEYRRCNFGETTPDFEDGTFAFKTGFGGEPVPTLRWERIDSVVGRALYQLGRDELVSRVFDTATRHRSSLHGGPS